MFEKEGKNQKGMRKNTETKVVTHTNSLVEKDSLL